MTNTVNIIEVYDETEDSREVSSLGVNDLNWVSSTIAHYGNAFIFCDWKGNVFKFYTHNKVLFGPVESLLNPFGRARN